MSKKEMEVLITVHEDGFTDLVQNIKIIKQVGPKIKKVYDELAQQIKP